MNRITLITVFFILFFINTYSQINNLKTFVVASELPLMDLTEQLQYDWDISPPTQQIGEETAKSWHTFSISYGESKQILQRVEILNIDTGFRTNTTSLIFNDPELLQNFKRNLPFEGYALKREKEKQWLYQNGYHTIVLTEGATEEFILSRGYYRIEFLNYGQKFLEEMKRKLAQRMDEKQRYSEEFIVLGNVNQDPAIFKIVGSGEENCQIEFRLKNKIYKSLNCNDYIGTAELVSKEGDTLKIEFALPELNSAIIDILGNDLRADYETDLEWLIENEGKY